MYACTYHVVDHMYACTYHVVDHMYACTYHATIVLASTHILYTRVIAMVFSGYTVL